MAHWQAAAFKPNTPMLSQQESHWLPAASGSCLSLKGNHTTQTALGSCRLPFSCNKQVHARQQACRWPTQPDRALTHTKTGHAAEDAPPSCTQQVTGTMALAAPCHSDINHNAESPAWVNAVVTLTLQM